MRKNSTIHGSTGGNAPLPPRISPPVDDLLTGFGAWLGAYRGRSVATVEKYQLTVRRLAAWCAGEGIELLRIDRDQLELFVGPELHRQGISPRARRPAVAALRAFFAWACHAGLASGNPARALDYPTAGRRLPRAMTLQSAERLLMAPDLSTLRGVRDAALLALLIGCGLRVGGLVRLDEDDLIWLQVEGRERLMLRAREKGGHERLLPVPDEARLLLRAYLGHPDLVAIDRLLPSGRRVLWVSTANQRVPAHEYHGEARRLSAHSVQQMIVRYGERAGIPRDQLHPHAARHLFGAELAEDDVSLLVAQALMGHRDPKSTQIYAHLAARKLMRAVDKSGPLGKIHTPVSGLARELRARGA